MRKNWPISLNQDLRTAFAHALIFWRWRNFPRWASQIKCLCAVETLAWLAGWPTIEKGWPSQTGHLSIRANILFLMWTFCHVLKRNVGKVKRGLKHSQHDITRPSPRCELGPPTQQTGAFFNWANYVLGFVKQFTWTLCLLPFSFSRTLRTPPKKREPNAYCLSRFLHVPSGLPPTP